MNKLVALLLLCLPGQSVFARDNFSISASYGAGWGFERKATTYSSLTTGIWTYSPGLVKRMDLGVNYRQGHFVLQTGFGYMVSSYTRSSPDRYYYQSQFSSPLTANGSLGVLYNDGPLARQTFSYPHLMVPLLMGYEARIARRFTVSATAGFMVSYNLRSSMKFEEDTISATYDITKDRFEKGYRLTSWWVAANGSISYEFIPHCSVFFGPRFAWMLSNFAKDDMYNFEGSKFKLYNVTLNAGISWQPGKRKHVEQK